MKVISRVDFNKLQKVAAQGANSKVYLATDTQLDGQLIVKEMPKSRFSNPSEFFEESRRAHASSHPNVVPIQYACQDSKNIYILMPICRGGSLDSRLKAGSLSPTDTIRVGLESLAGLGHVHTQNVLHLDIKPSNVLFDENGKAMLADFGQSRDMQALGIVSNLPRMYRWCLPPEAIDPQTLDLTGYASVESDIYQLGVTLYIAVNGTYYVRQQRMTDPAAHRKALLKGKFPNRRFLPHVPRRLQTAIRKAISVDPGQRFRSAAEFADELSRIDVDTNWTMQGTGLGASSWTVVRGRTKWRVLLNQGASADRWNVEVWTQRAGGSARRRGVSSGWWSQGLTLRQAQQHLGRVFKEIQAS